MFIFVYFLFHLHKSVCYRFVTFVCIHSFKNLEALIQTLCPERNIEILKPTIDCVKLCYISERS